MHAFFTAHAADLVDVQRTVQQIVEQARSDAAFRERGCAQRRWMLSPRTPDNSRSL